MYPLEVAVKTNTFPFFGMSLFFICFDLVFVFLFLNATVAKCRLESGRNYTCNISKLFLGKYQVSERTVEGITDVRVVSDGCSDGCSYRMEFVKNNGSQEPFNIVYTDRGPVNDQAEFFHAQISSRKDTFTYRADPPWWVAYLLGGLTLLFIPQMLFRARKRSAVSSKIDDVF